MKSKALRPLAAATLAIVMAGGFAFTWVRISTYSESDARRLAPLAFSETVSIEKLDADEYLEPAYYHRAEIGWEAIFAPKRGNAAVVVSLDDVDRRVRVYVRLTDGTYRSVRTSL